MLDLRSSSYLSVKRQSFVARKKSCGVCGFPKRKEAADLKTGGLAGLFLEKKRVKIILDIKQLKGKDRKCQQHAHLHCFMGKKTVTENRPHLHDFTGKEKKSNKVFHVRDFLREKCLIVSDTLPAFHACYPSTSSGFTSLKCMDLGMQNNNNNSYHFINEYDL